MKTIDEVWIVIGENPDGEPREEGIICAKGFPLMMVEPAEPFDPDDDPGRGQALRRLAQIAAGKSQKELRIVRFRKVDVIATITPDPRVITCPVCKAGSSPQQRTYGTSNVTMCVKCRSICKYTADGAALVLMTEDEIAELSPELRAEIARARALLRRAME
jgi:hypothetical protein